MAALVLSSESLSHVFYSQMEWLSTRENRQPNAPSEPVDPSSSQRKEALTNSAFTRAMTLDTFQIKASSRRLLWILKPGLLTSKIL